MLTCLILIHSVGPVKVTTSDVALICHSAEIRFHFSMFKVRKKGSAAVGKRKSQLVLLTFQTLPTKESIVKLQIHKDLRNPSYRGSPTPPM